jgi:hypothetical protein
MGQTASKGRTGPIGPKGPIGIKGSNGFTGPMGPEGPLGLVGPLGPTGPIGLMGPSGGTGPKGDRGERGYTGPAGVGSGGGGGPKGDTGIPGSQGPKGDRGNTGIPGDPGPKGDRGNTGIPGPPGGFGPKGDAGNSVFDENVAKDKTLWCSADGKICKTPLGYNVESTGKSIKIGQHHLRGDDHWLRVLKDHNGSLGDYSGEGLAANKLYALSSIYSENSIQANKSLQVGKTTLVSNDDWLRPSQGVAAPSLWTNDGNINGRNIFAELDQCVRKDQVYAIQSQRDKQHLRNKSGSINPIYGGKGEDEKWKFIQY